ncbi:MAG: hypothetical protein MZV63_57455, partial [Marinilabiliales bacterium]|nr:hypothetical protein [Marinilabiliales bacterium]
YYFVQLRIAKVGPGNWDTRLQHLPEGDRGALRAPVRERLSGSARTWILQFVLLGSGERWCEEEVRASLRAHAPTSARRIGYWTRICPPHRGGRRLLPHAEPLRALRPQPDVLPPLRHPAHRPPHRGPRRTRSRTTTRTRATGTGFIFDNLTPRADLRHRRLGGLGLVQPARSHRRDARGAPCRGSFTWDRSAGEYAELYARAARGCGPRQARPREHPEDA